MAMDLQVDDNGDLVIDPDTHDLATVDGAAELAQRIKATLDIHYGEMENLDPEMGADYSNFLGKDLDEEHAADDMSAAIIAFVPEVVSVDNIVFTELPGRKLEVTFTASYDDEDGIEQSVEGDYTIGS